MPYVQPLLGASFGCCCEGLKWWGGMDGVASRPLSYKTCLIFGTFSLLNVFLNSREAGIAHPVELSQLLVHTIVATYSWASHFPPLNLGSRGRWPTIKQNALHRYVHIQAVKECTFLRSASSCFLFLAYVKWQNLISESLLKVSMQLLWNSLWEFSNESILTRYCFNYRAYYVYCVCNNGYNTLLPMLFCFLL